jgi:lysophospholipase L1-like esterase
MPGISVSKTCVPFGNGGWIEWMLSPYFSLPSSGVSLMVGQEVTIYGDSLVNVPIINSLSVTYTCDIGTQSGNNLTINPVAGNIGDHSLTMRFYNGGVLFETKTITLSVYAEAPAGTKKILMVGDSLMASGSDYYHTQLDIVLNNCTLIFLGSKGTTTKHEGIAGYRWDMFAANTLSPTYPSPFFKAGVLDIAAYFTDNAIDVPDYVYIMLGVNDTWGHCAVAGNGLTDIEITTIINYAKTLIDGFLTYNASLKIILGIPTICDKDGVGWAASYDEVAQGEDLYISNMHKYWLEFITEFANGAYDIRVDCSYEAINLDRANYANGVHPDATGYAQLGMGQALYYNKILKADLAPTTLTVVWENDYAKIDFVDVTGGVAEHEIWSSKNGSAYTLVTTLAAGTATYNAATWQNASMNYRVRAKSGVWYSDYTAVVNIITPLVFKTNQATITNLIVGLRITPTYTVNINWGDGTNNNYSNNNAITKTYTSIGNPYYVIISGDINKIMEFSITSNNYYGDVSKWSLPPTLKYPSMKAQAVGSGVTGDISNWNYPTALAYLLMAVTGGSTNKISGNISALTFPVGVVRFYMESQDLTGCPHGNYKDFDAAIGLLLTGNNLSVASVSNLLIDIAAYFSGIAPYSTPVIPDNNTKFALGGTGMGIPNAAGLAAKTAIETIYAAAGFTATITVNS